MHIFETTDPVLKHRNGKTVHVLTSRSYGTVRRVRFADGFETEAFSTELTESPSPFTVVGAAEYDAATDTLTPLEEPNRWESAGKLPANRALHVTHEYRDTL